MHQLSTVTLKVGARTCCHATRSANKHLTKMNEHKLNNIMTTENNKRRKKKGDFIVENPCYLTLL